MAADFTQAELEAYSLATVNEYAPNAPDEVKKIARRRLENFVATGRGLDFVQRSTPSAIIHACGAASILGLWRDPPARAVS